MIHNYVACGLYFLVLQANTTLGKLVVYFLRRKWWEWVTFSFGGPVERTQPLDLCSA